MTRDTINALARHLRVFWRSESIILEIRARDIMRRTGLMAFAGLIAVFGLAMLNIAAYFALAPIWGNAWAMLAVAIADFVIAGILVAIAGRDSVNPQLVTATELRDHALEGLENEASGAADRLVHKPFEIAGSVSSLIVSLILGFLRSRR